LFVLRPSSASLQRNPEATVFVGNLDDAVDEDLLWELFTQVSPVVSVHQPRDRISGRHSGFSFIELRSEEDAEYVAPTPHPDPHHGP
jgi:splicing factor 3B subunit 4